MDQQGDPLLNSLVAAYLAKVAPTVAATFKKTVKVRGFMILSVRLFIFFFLKKNLKMCMTIMSGWRCSWCDCGSEGGGSAFLKHRASSKKSRLGQWR